MSEEPLGAAIERDLNEAIAKVIAQHEGGFVTKWLALVESAGPDGERGLWTCTSEGITKWDTMGMLAYAAQVEAAGIGHEDD